MQLKGSRTEANLAAAFAGESQARNKYTFFAHKARQDGYEQIADLFEETASNEMAHARLWFRLLRGGELSDTKGCLEDAAGGERFEWESMYRDFAEKAREEGFASIAFLFEAVAEVERMHEQRFRTLIDNLDKGIVFSRDGDTIWQCRVCGHISIGRQAPEVCPICSRPQAYFQIQARNY